MQEFTALFPEFVDNVLLQEFNTCENKWWQRHVMGKVIKREDTSIHLVAGGAFAKGLEVTRKAFYVQGKSVADSILLGQQALIAAYGEERDGEMKSRRKLVEVLGNYFNHWPLMMDEGVVPVEEGIENIFSIPIPRFHPVTGKQLVYSGRIDLLGKVVETDYIMEDVETSYLVGVDEKTTRYIDKNWVYSWDITGQFIGYLWAAKQLNLDVKEWRVRGIALGRKEFDSTLDFKEVPVRPNSKLIEQWYNDMLVTVDRMLTVWQQKNARRVYGAGCHQYFTDCAYMRECQCVNGVPEYMEVRWNPSNADIE